MKLTTKVTLGLSVAAAAGIASTVFISDKVITKVRHVTNRKKAEHFVEDKFKGNETLLNFVDNLDDKDIESFMNVAKKVSDKRDKVAAYGDNVKNATGNVKNKIVDLMDKNC
ncbi:hypothetical protein LQF61_08795 [Tetragenococcus koreensis]|uniref:YtxH domain-containing protein n=1 Tax=Tetragenococcus koreensis TaxID=290335 RepID=A0AAN4UCV5_9ENTE|nr:hypothetical protein [Tetragenococcus koreensis]AYW45639.1 hypothetical protein C7K43_06600 [Tetragenococcus koreensis]MCF1586274.1 hypothetical protein [Tetragenococcus koreensis]MCF1614824.1 hypothetical protein [Tetragenococcus koreensis]MCF1617609.1 hypothetical protein [Tetragenococcus koreensis]MCF1620167.1 hypothetical protein [Tetragenococcus koreensis]